MQTETDKMKWKLRLRVKKSATAEVLMECFIPCIALKNLPMVTNMPNETMHKYLTLFFLKI